MSIDELTLARDSIADAMVDAQAYNLPGLYLAHDLLSEILNLPKVS